MDLIVRNARLADRPSGELFDIGVEQGRIVALEHALAGEAEIYEIPVNPAAHDYRLTPDLRRLLQRAWRD
jgi:hypothetical protein